MLLGTGLLAQCLHGHVCLTRLSPLPAVVVVLMYTSDCQTSVWPLVSFVMQGKTQSYAAAAAAQHF